MKAKMCVTNLNLFVRDDGDFERLFCSQGQKAEVELEEYHCLGLCFLCQQGPTAIVEEKIVHHSGK